jgi:hypothetical protein
VGQGHSLASLSLASHKRGVGSSDGVWGADWAAVVSPSPRDEASAKQVVPWRDRHAAAERDKESLLRQPWAPLCVSGWSHGCAVQPLQRPVTVASALQTSHTLKCTSTDEVPLYMSVDTNQASYHPNTYTREASVRDASSSASCNDAYGRVNANVPFRQPLPHLCYGSLDEAARMLDRSSAS